MAVLPSAESATDQPCKAFPTAPLPASLLPCWLQTLPLRVYTHTAPPPALLLSEDPPTMRVLPSADSATDWPCRAFPPAPVPTSLAPFCVKSASAGCAAKSSATDSKAGLQNRTVFLAIARADVCANRALV